MILNHKEAIRFLVDGVAEIAFNRYTICNLHAILSNNLLPDERAAGRLRRIPVGIDGSVFHPLEVPQLIEECFDQILGKATAIRDPFEQAFFLMVHLPYLQPFDDVNKRVSRLAANISLIRANLSPLSFVDVPSSLYTRAILAVYELNDTSLLKDVFCWAYVRSAARYSSVRQSLGEPDPFRFRHREALREIVSEIIRMRIDRRTASHHIKQWSAGQDRHCRPRALLPDGRERPAGAESGELRTLSRETFRVRCMVSGLELEGWLGRGVNAPSRIAWRQCGSRAAPLSPRLGLGHGPGPAVGAAAGGRAFGRLESQGGHAPSPGGPALRSKGKRSTSR